MRKAPDIWPRWSVGNGNGLHPLQLKIAMRAARLLKVGGRLVYSTCTFNPIEDEAVVAAMMKQSEGALELLDVSNLYPELRRVPGVRTWEIWDKFGKHETHDGPEEKHKLHETMFPRTPTPPTSPSSDACASFLIKTTPVDSSSRSSRRRGASGKL